MSAVAEGNNAFALRLFGALHAHHTASGEILRKLNATGGGDATGR